MTRKARRSAPSRSAQRAFWWSGIACLVGAMTGVFLDVSATAVVSLGGIGLLLCLISLIIQIKREGFTVDALEPLSGCLALSFGVFGYFFHDTDWALLTAFGGFFFFLFVNFGAQILGQWGDTKDLWRRWRER